ncbi:MAG: thiamine-phosphate kinase [Spirochaetaceae bacterium]
MLVHEVGEFELIARLERILPQTGRGVVKAIGDDCAVLDLPRELTVWTTDTCIEGVHYLPYLATPHQIGRKALLANLSDIASMGATPRYATLSLSAPPEAEVSWIEELYRGIADLAAEYEVAVVGGNTSRSPHGLRLDIGVLGTVAPGELLRRDTAEAGDLVLVTGSVGDAYCGLECVFNPTLPVEPRLRTALIERYRSPSPHLKSARVIASSGIATSMIDISDGLAADLGHLCDASQVGVELRAADLPISEDVARFAAYTDQDPWQYALIGGDDYGLLLTARADRAAELVEEVRESTGDILTVFGTVTSDPRRLLHLPDGRVERLTSKGWNHFQGEEDA